MAARRVSAMAAVVAGGAYFIVVRNPKIASSDRGDQVASIKQKISDPFATVPPRSVQQLSLSGASVANPLDVLVIGGGATGCGIALDAATRGLRVGLVERDDFSSGSSSRSTKLIHGGVGDLEKFVFSYGRLKLAPRQIKLVYDALVELKQIIDNAPHLCSALPCMTPCFKWFDLIYYWAVWKMYDLVAGWNWIHFSRCYSAQESVELFPALSRNGNDRNLKGTVVSYYGQINDSRLNVALACTAALAGAAVLNHAEVMSLLRDEGSGRIIGARVRNNLSGKEFETYAKVVVNAAGPFCDSVRNMADKEAKPMILPSSSVHIVLPDYCSPEGMGLIVPKTKAGPAVFMLPWLGQTLAGTTDSNNRITMLPEPHEDEIEFILHAISDYLNIKVQRGDVLSAWSGIRPLPNTKSITGDHAVSEDFPGLVTIIGGMWTTYRRMAENALDVAIQSGKLRPTNKCMTRNLQLGGADGWDLSSFILLAQRHARALDTATSKHLSHAYGTYADRVVAIAQNENLGKRLAHAYPVLEAEVAYCARHEYCESVVDFVARRSRLAFLDTDAAQTAVPRIIQILASEHEWDEAREKEELQKAQEFLVTFKLAQNVDK